nr:hypothetical protein [Gaiella occulta]
MAHEGADRGQAEVARARRIAARLLEVVEEVEHQRRVEVVEGQRRRCPSGALLGVAEQQLEGVAVARDRVRAGAALGEQAPLEELL